jgi:ketosteroid isomerase-like protein
MKHMAVIFLLLSSAFLAFGQSKTSNSNTGAKKELIQIERDLAKASLALDAAMYNRIWADDMIAVNPAGIIYTKTEDQAALKSGKLKFDTFDVDQMNVRIFGETAIVVYRQTVKGHYDDHPINDLNRVTDVFVRRKGKWQLVSEHTSLIQQ